MTRNILNFIPELQLTPHSALFLYLSKLQRSYGDSVFFVSCKGAVSRCLIRDSVRGFPQEYGQDLCNQCQSIEADFTLKHDQNFVQMRSESKFKAKKIITQIILNKGVDFLFNNLISYEDFLLSEVTYSQFYLINKKNHMDQF